MSHASTPPTFNFPTYSINNDKVTVDDIKNTELWLLGNTARCYADKMQAINDKGIKGIGGFVGYFKHAYDTIESIDLSDATQDMKKIVGLVENNIHAAYDKAQLNIGRLKAGDYQKEVWDFYQAAVELTVDSIKILTNIHKPIKNSGGEFDHNTRIQFNHGNNVWVYNVRIKGSKGVSVKSFLNGVEQTINNRASADVDFMLQRVAWVMGMDRAYKHIAKIAHKDPRAIKKALLMAGVLGGDYNYYLVIAKHFDQFVTDAMRKESISKHEAMVFLLEQETRATPSEIKALVELMSAN